LELAEAAAQQAGIKVGDQQERFFHSEACRRSRCSIGGRRCNSHQWSSSSKTNWRSRGFVEDVLSEAGFDAVSLSSGEQALTLLKGERRKFGALVADVKLNGTLDGWTVAKRAHEIMAAIGHLTLAEAERYTREAERRR
jgi:hypothetical protein